MDKQHHNDARIDIEAAEWMVRVTECEPHPHELQAADRESQAAFCQWLSKSPAHVRGFLETVETYRKLASIDPRRQLRVPRRSIEIATVTSIVRHSASGLNIRQSGGAGRNRSSLNPSMSPRRGYRPLWAVAILSFMVVFPVAMERFNAATVTYSTEVGERRLITLKDGSQIHLNTQTQVRVNLTPRFREVRLTEGEALFTVKHDPHRPFIVVTDDARIEDEGTEFSVYRAGAGETRIVVMTGEVNVSKVDARPVAPVLARRQAPSQTLSNTVPLPITLRPGNSARIIHGATAAELESRPLSPHELERKLGWCNGLLVFEGETLSEAIAEFNRYNRQRIVIDDPGIASLRLGGTFSANDPGTFATAVERTLQLRAINRGPDSSIHLSAVH